MYVLHSSGGDFRNLLLSLGNVCGWIDENLHYELIIKIYIIQR